MKTYETPEYAIESAYNNGYKKGYEDGFKEGYEGGVDVGKRNAVKHGRWLYEAHKEQTNYRWNVTAECSECCDEKKEIWAGFFPNVPDWLARDVALQSAKSVKMSNYCPNCGADMRGEEDG